MDAGSSSLSAQRSRLFAKLKDKMQSGTGPSGFDKLCRADKELITEFVEGAEKGEGSFTTVNGYLSVLINFGKWLSQENKGSLQSFVSKDKNTQTADTSNFQKWTKGARLAAALTHLRQVASPTHEPIKIRSYSRHKATEGDEAFINNALSTMPDYAASLRGLSEWLYINRKEPLCKPGRLHSQALRDDAKAFATTRLGGSQKAVRALWQLETFYDTGKTDVVKRLNTRNLPKDDQQLIEQYKHKLWVASDGKTYPNKETYAGKKSSYARRFSAWLQAQGKDSMASRLHDPTLDTDLDLYKATKESIYHCDIISMLRQVREMPTPNVQPPGLGSSAEPSGSSYPSMVAPTHSGGAPQTSHSWDLNISAEELVGPSGSAPPEPQAPQRSWDLNMPAAEVSGASGSAQSEPSSSTLAFNRDALHPEATGPQRTTAMSQASLPTFNEDDTGPN
ncbi:hypothetical protein BER93_17055 [Xanthomonas fragariae]|nr:hypothetical protein BER92_17000 [Xanthomonas fragariae]AOD19502.1 hypothetical protein BER93_17055 [Xanthomonas fragariae]ENZ96887.1 hypothetical protein O1K_01589 [Xanthomonas fragariae LMG 25863]